MPSFLNNYFYGKAGKADYTPEQMPKNRVQLFFEMLRIHLSGMVGVNLIYVVFCIPALLWTLLNTQVLLIPEAEAAEVAVGALMQNVLPTYLLLMIPCLVIAGIGAPGMMYVLRNWARDQHSFSFSDYKDNVKQNWKCGALTGLINGASLYIAYIAYSFYGSMSSQSILFIVPQMLVLIVCALWWMINMLIFPMMVTYDMNFVQLVRNCALISLARMPLSIAFLLGALLIPVLVVLLAPGYAIIFLVLFYLVIGFSLTGFAYASYANSCFDKYLNPKIEGAPINMGLRDPSLDDDDEDDEEGEDAPAT